MSLLIGALFLNPLFRTTRGVVSDALAGALADVGINDNFVKKLASNIEPCKGVLFTLVRMMTSNRLLGEIKKFGGVVLKISLDESKEPALREALARAKQAESTYGATEP